MYRPRYKIFRRAMQRINNFNEKYKNFQNILHTVGKLIAMKCITKSRSLFQQKLFFFHIKKLEEYKFHYTNFSTSKNTFSAWIIRQKLYHFVPHRCNFQVPTLMNNVKIFYEFFQANFPRSFKLDEKKINVRQLTPNISQRWK